MTDQLDNSEIPFVHVCLLGPSGIGKSPLASLFKLGRFEPYRVRIPRDEKDAEVCKTEQECAETLKEEQTACGKPVAFPKSPNGLSIYENWAFFEVRKKKQLLEFRRKKKLELRLPRRIEVFAPVLVEILGSRPAMERIGLAPGEEQLIAILLNPSSVSFSTEAGSELDYSLLERELRQAVMFATTERTRQQGKPIDFADSLERARNTNAELNAWRALHTMKNTVQIVECRGWKHFEFRYHQPSGSELDARRELAMARETLLEEFRKQAPTALGRLQSMKALRAVEEILGLTSIV